MSVPSNAVNMYDPQVPIPQSIYEESTTALGDVGTRLRVGERTFYYAKAGTNLSPGLIYCAPCLTGTAQRATLALWTNLTGSANVLTITAGTALTVNQLADGYLVTASAALSGGGLTFKIKSNAAISSGGTGNVTLYDDIPVATVAAGPADIIANQFNGVKLGSVTLDAPVGVAPIAVTSGNYCWLQTWGPCGVQHSAASVAGAIISMGTLGLAVTPFDATTNGGVAAYSLPIGKNVMQAATATQVNPVFLMLAP